jgi:uncharacterized BrkB/YihY/UPF0761 family membrane protein
VSTDPQRKKSTASLLSFIFTILFVLHIMLLPVWMGIRAIMIFETDNGFFSTFPPWFVGSAVVCLTVALIFGILPQNEDRSDDVSNT